MKFLKDEDDQSAVKWLYVLYVPLVAVRGFRMIKFEEYELVSTHRGEVRQVKVIESEPGKIPWLEVVPLMVLTLLVYIVFIVVICLLSIQR